MNENNLPEHVLNKDSGDQTTPPLTSASTDNMHVADSEVQSNTMLSRPVEKQNLSDQPLPDDTVHMEYTNEQPVTINQVTFRDDGANKKDGSIMGGSVQHKKGSFNKVMTSLFVVWMLLGGYYFFGGSFDLSFLQGNLAQNIQSDDFELPNFGENEITNSNIESNFIDLDQIDIAQNTNDMDAIDKIFLSNGKSNDSGGKVKGVQKSYANDIGYANYDTDGDGLADTTEKVLGTNYQVVDTDGDGLSDYQEVGIYRTDPLSTDTDGDGATDDYEILKGTNPLKLKF